MSVFRRARPSANSPLPASRGPRGPVITFGTNLTARTGLGGLQILEEHSTPFSKCNMCGSQVPPWRLGNRHYESYKFRIREELQIKRKALQHCFEDSPFLISVNSEPLEPVAYFPYLGRKVAYNHSDWSALYQNLWKAH